MNFVRGKTMTSQLVIFLSIELRAIPDLLAQYNSPIHWSTEETIVQYLKGIIINRQRELLSDDCKAALEVMGNFKGKVTTIIIEAKKL